MSERQRALADAILGDPDVASLSSFVGVDGTNPTLNSGRMLINLKPRAQPQRLRPARSSGACSARPRACQGIIALHAAGAGPHHRSDGEPHAVPVRAGERQAGGFRRLGAAPARPPAEAARDRRRDERPRRPRACRCSSRSTAMPPRASASPPPRSTTCSTTRFGQRIVSTVYTQSNQYRVIYEVEPSMARSIDSLYNLYLPGVRRQAGAAVGHRHLRGTLGAASHRPAGPVPGHHHLVQPGAGRRARPGGRRHHRPRSARSACRLSITHALPGRRARLPEVARQPAAADPGRHHHGLHRAGRALRELHPSRSRSCRPCRRPASAPCWR